MRAKVVCLAFGILFNGGIAAQAQTSIDNPYSSVSAVGARFTPDVARDLGSPVRIRVVLHFKGDSWRLESARQEAGINSTYPDKTGFVQAELATAEGVPLSSVARPDPRIVHIYEQPQQIPTWSGPDGRLRFPHGTLIPRVAEMRAHPILQPAIAARDVLLVGPDAATKEAQAVGREPQAQTGVIPPAAANLPQFHANVSQNRAELARLAGALQHSVRFQSTRPPHVDVSVTEGDVTLFLPNSAKGCVVNVTVASVTGSPIHLSTPLADFEGHPRCVAH